MKHYYYPGRAITTDWMLKELDAPHEQIFVDFPNGAGNTPEFRALSPMGKVPVLVDGATVITETAAICAYLADKFSEKGFAPPPGSQERGKYYRYLFFAGNTLEPLLSLRAMGIVHPDATQAGWGDLPRVLAAVESMTPAAGWVLGDPFSAADVIFGGWLDYSIRMKWIDASPKLAAYMDRLRARPVYQATHAWPDEMGG